jgi:acetate kinase
MPAPPREVKRMHEPILVINAGSSSIKFSMFETGAHRSLSPAAHGENAKQALRDKLSEHKQ